MKELPRDNSLRITLTRHHQDLMGTLPDSTPSKSDRGSPSSRDPPWSPFAHLRAAEVLEATGDAPRAAELYRSALAAWVEAEEGFEPKDRAESGMGRVGG